MTVANAKPVPREWSVLIGDCIHNARCVLDHAVYQVAAGDEKQLRQSQFPMLPSQNDKEFDRRLPGVPDPYREIVRRWQPYEMARGATGALVRLADLSNRDKHRLLNVVTLLFDHPWVGLSGSHVEAEWVNPGPVRIEDGAVAMQNSAPSQRASRNASRWCWNSDAGDARAPRPAVVAMATGRFDSPHDHEGGRPDPARVQVSGTVTSLESPRGARSADVLTVRSPAGALRALRPWPAPKPAAGCAANQAANGGNANIGRSTP